MLWLGHALMDIVRQQYLLSLELMLGAKTSQQRVKTFEIGRHLDFVVQIIFDPCSFMRR